MPYNAETAVLGLAQAHSRHLYCLFRVRIAEFDDFERSLIGVSPERNGFNRIWSDACAFYFK